MGLVAYSHIERDFEASIPNTKWFSDITEFRVGEKKLYRSPILVACGRYIVSYNVSANPNLDQIKDMLEKAFEENYSVDNLIIHANQDWQYQHDYFVDKLKGLTPVQHRNQSFSLRA